MNSTSSSKFTVSPSPTSNYTGSPILTSNYTASPLTTLNTTQFTTTASGSSGLTTFESTNLTTITSSTLTPPTTSGLALENKQWLTNYFKSFIQCIVRFVKCSSVGNCSYQNYWFVNFFKRILVLKYLVAYRCRWENDKIKVYFIHMYKCIRYELLYEKIYIGFILHGQTVFMVRTCGR